MPAVTQENGQLACTTAITRRYFYNQPDLEAGRNPCGTRVFTGMNSNVQRYFDSRRFPFPPYHNTKFIGPAINLPTHGPNNESRPDVTSASLITKTTDLLVLETPFAHEPSWNVTNLDDYGGYNVSTGKPCPGVFDHAIVDYGYVPQAFIEFITQKFPKITSGFPPGATLLPGGPSIMEGIVQLLVEPASLDAAEDLTVSTSFTISNTGCFHPDLCLAKNNAPNIVATTTVSTAQSLVQRPNSPVATSTQASKTTFLASLANNNRETSVLKSSAVASTSSVASSAETAHPADDAPITTKAVALPSRSASSVVLQISESSLLLGFERTVQESFAASLLPSIGPSQLTPSVAPKDIPDSQTFSPATGSPIAVYKTTSGSAPQVSELVVNHGMTSKLPAHPGPVIKIGSHYLTPYSVLEYTMDRETPVASSTPIVVSTATHSLTAEVSALIVNGVTSPLSINLQATTFPKVKTSSQYLTPGPRLRYILGNITLIPGASPIVFSGTTYSLAPEASILVANGVTSILHEQKTLPTSLPKSTPTDSGRLRYILAGQTLSPDMPTITVSGLVISLAALGNTVVIDGRLFPFSTGTILSLTVGSQLLIATPASDLSGSDQVSQVGPAARITSDGNARNTASATNMTTSNTNPLLSTLPASITGEGVPPVSVFTGKASWGGYGFPQMLRLSLIVLGLILLQAS